MFLSQAWKLYFALVSSDAKTCLGWLLPRQLAELLVVCVVKALAGAGQRPQVILRLLSQAGCDYQAAGAQALGFHLDRMAGTGSPECDAVSPWMEPTDVVCEFQTALIVLSLELLLFPCRFLSFLSALAGVGLELPLAAGVCRTQDGRSAAG